ncbi:MAG: hypothetical protein HQM09_21700 [Candidatus Riflebacteria bacterium]|nr:hypothetical protein [Candidatus Riflebacteria bacterium]
MSMDYLTAFQVLELSVEADAATIKAAFAKKRDDYEMRISTAPTETLKGKYRSAANELEEARSVAVAHSQSRAATSGPAATAAFSATKLADLPDVRQIYAKELPVFLVVLLLLTLVAGQYVWQNPGFVSSLFEDKAARARLGKEFTDPMSGLEWKAGSDRDTNFGEAEYWINGLNGGWKAPTKEQLGTLFLNLHVSGKMLPFVDSEPVVWATAMGPSGAWIVTFGCIEKLNNSSYRSGHRALAVRSRR